MKTKVSGKTTGLILLVFGLIIGAGLVFTLNFTYDVLTPRTITTTWTMTSFVVLTVPGPVTTSTGYVVIQVSVASCVWSGSREYCEMVLNNSGTLGTATTGNCTMSYGTHTYEGYAGPTTTFASSPGAPQQLPPGSSRTTYCQTSAGVAAGAGAQVTGSVILAGGASVEFAATASS